jgi:hypothetical protein
MKKNLATALALAFLMVGSWSCSSMCKKKCDSDKACQEKCGDKACCKENPSCAAPKPVDAAAVAPAETATPAPTKKKKK